MLVEIVIFNGTNFFCQRIISSIRLQLSLFLAILPSIALLRDGNDLIPVAYYFDSISFYILQKGPLLGIGSIIVILKAFLKVLRALKARRKCFHSRRSLIILKQNISLLRMMIQSSHSRQIKMLQGTNWSKWIWGTQNLGVILFKSQKRMYLNQLCVLMAIKF